MKLLIIGGTRFVGRHLVAAALARDHAVTLFNRGQHMADVFAGVETIHGDRNTQLDRLNRHNWDAVIDTCGYLPKVVDASAKFLADKLDRYAFISSQSVYADVSKVGVDENSPLKQLTSDQVTKANAIDTTGQSSAFSYGEMYGGLKALCEQAAEERMTGRVLTIRPGLIVGPADYTDRFTYWVTRIDRGGEVLAPGRPERFVQFIDARDLAEWIVLMIEQRRTGIYNANGPPGSVTMKDVLETCKSVSGSNASFTWVDEDFLAQEGVVAWSEMPLYLPESVSRFKGFMFISTTRAVDAGLHTRPLAETIRDTLSWSKPEGSAASLKAGIENEREEMLLQKFRHSRQSSALRPSNY